MRRNTNQQPYTTQQRELPPTEYESIGYEQGYQPLQSPPPRTSRVTEPGPTVTYQPNGPQPQVIIIHTKQPEQVYIVQSRAVVGISISLIIIGVLEISLNIGALLIMNNNDYLSEYPLIIGAGIWGGIFVSIFNPGKDS